VQLKTRDSRRLGVLALVAGSAVVALDARAQAPAAPVQGAADPLGTLAVPPGGVSRPLPKIAVLASAGAALEESTLRAVIARDLDLSGEFEVLAPLDDTPARRRPKKGAGGELDLETHARRGAEAVVVVHGKPSGDQIELAIEGYLVKEALAAAAAAQKGVPAWKPKPPPPASFARAILAPAADLRVESHRLADHVLGALTGHAGGFASRLAFAAPSGGARRVFVVDADGEGLAPVSPPERLAIAPAFGAGGEVFYAASLDQGEFQLFGPSGKRVPVPVAGSIYGLAFSPDKSKVAATIGVGDSIRLFTGADLASLKPASDVDLAMQPALGPRGEIAFVGQGKLGRPVFVDGKPVTPDVLVASSPTFCNHPDGVKLVFAAGAGKATDLVVTGERGGGLARLTRGQGSNGYPACSPDGRLVAFFSTRTSGEGPGLYVMRIDGGRSRRISKQQGYALAWDALPPSRATVLRR
jgi:TolB protein